MQVIESTCAEPSALAASASQQYLRFATVDTSTGLAVLADSFENRKKRNVIAGQEVNTRSVRLKTFHKHGLCCAHCGLVASFFALERQENNQQSDRFHLNLYGVKPDGQEVLFTHDHVIPRSRGGQDNVGNTQTMCRECNNTKGNRLESELKRAA